MALLGVNHSLSRNKFTSDDASVLPSVLHTLTGLTKLV